MDKKKVKELMEQVLNYCDQCYNPNWQPKSFEEFIKLSNICREAIKELSKSDWVSVEDVLPPYGERVLVRCGNTGLETVEVRHNYLECAFSKLLDGNGFLDSYKVTHWKPIGKLEE